LWDVDLKNEFKEGGRGSIFSFSKEGGLKFDFMYKKKIVLGLTIFVFPSLNSEKENNCIN